MNRHGKQKASSNSARQSDYSHQQLSLFSNAKGFWNRKSQVRTFSKKIAVGSRKLAERTTLKIRNESCKSLAEGLEAQTRLWRAQGDKYLSAIILHAACRKKQKLKCDCCLINRIVMCLDVDIVMMFN